MAAHDAGESAGGARHASHDISIIINDEGGAERVAMEDTRRLDSPSTTADFDDMISQLHDDNPEHYNHSRPRTFRKLSNSSSIISDIFRHPDISEDRLRGKIRKANVSEHRRRSSVDLLLGILRDTLPLHSSPSRSDIPTPQAKTDDVGSLGSKRRKKKKKKKWHPPSFWFIFRRKEKKQQQQQQQEEEAEGKKKAPEPTTIGAQLSMKDLAVVPREAHDVGEPSTSAGKLPLPVVVETRSGPLRRSFERAAAITGLSPVEESRESVDSLLDQLIRCAAGDTDAPRPSPLPNPPDENLDKEPPPGPATIAEQMLMRRESFPLRITDDSAVAAAATPPPSPRRRRAGPALRRRGSISGLSSSIEGSGSPARKHCRPPRPQPSIEGDSELLIADGIRSTPRRRRQRWGGWSIESNLSRAGARAYSIADSIASNSSEPVVADATTAQGGYLPRVVVVERPASSSSRRLVVTNAVAEPSGTALDEHATTAHQLSPTPVMLVADIRPSSPSTARPSSTASESAQCRQQQQQQQQHQKLRSDSHLELARRYKELGLSHRRELATLLGTMEQLERHNASWLNAITALFDKLTQSLGQQRCCGRCNSSSMRGNMEDQEALCDASPLRGRTEPGITSAMGRGAWLDVGMDDNDDFARDVPQQHRRHSAPPRACNRSVDLDHGQSVASNRRRVRFSDSHLAAQQQQRHAPPSPTGLDVLEPLMRELVMGVDIADN